MKQGIHPDYKPSLVTCACGASYTTKSTRGSFTVDVCGACHPFYTGKHKVMDVAGRVDKFRRKYASNPIVAANTATAIAAQAAADAAPAPAPKDS